MKKHLAFIALLVLSLAQQSFAQMGMGKIEDIEKIQKRKLIVITEEPRENIINKLTKKKKLDHIDKYKSDLQLYNTRMKEVVEQFWNYKENGVEYMTLEEMEKLKKGGNTKYAILYCVSQKASRFHAGYVSKDGLQWSYNMKGNSDDDDYFEHFTTMIVNVIEDYGKTPAYTANLPDIFPTKASIMFGISGTNAYFDMRIRKKKNGEKVDAAKELDETLKTNGPKLKDKTLLIRKDLLDKDLTEASIKNHYKFPYKVCESEEIDEAIVNQDATKAYAVILPYVFSTSNANSMLYFHYVFDAENNTMMAYVKPSMGGMMVASQLGGKAGQKKISDKILKEISDAANAKKK